MVEERKPDLHLVRLDCEIEEPGEVAVEGAGLEDPLGGLLVEEGPEDWGWEEEEEDAHEAFDVFDDGGGVVGFGAVEPMRRMGSPFAEFDGIEDDAADFGEDVALRGLVVVGFAAEPEDEEGAHHEDGGDGEGERVGVVDAEVRARDGGEEGADVHGEVVHGEEVALHALLHGPVRKRVLDLVPAKGRPARFDPPSAKRNQPQRCRCRPKQRTPLRRIRLRESRERHHPIPQTVHHREVQNCPVLALQKFQIPNPKNQFTIKGLETLNEHRTRERGCAHQNAVAEECADDGGGVARDDEEVDELGGFVLAEAQVLHQVEREDGLHPVEAEALAELVPYQVLDAPRKRTRRLRIHPALLHPRQALLVPTRPQGRVRAILLLCVRHLQLPHNPRPPASKLPCPRHHIPLPRVSSHGLRAEGNNLNVETKSHLHDRVVVIKGSSSGRRLADSRVHVEVASPQEHDSDARWVTVDASGRVFFWKR
jgi:hypothetical protein